ncbi:hypothetical protein FHR32_003833 [Streptosporangium album]|uniref:Uncharacterized protein n=1 Tax=Streptosporangium album TaxID=47479 RepID=A0A7W7RWF8_9ACTN|nr:hypothetical protein [Streptosporangium album]
MTAPAAGHGVAVPGAFIGSAAAPAVSAVSAASGGGRGGPVARGPRRPEPEVQKPKERPMISFMISVVPP